MFTQCTGQFCTAGSACRKGLDAFPIQNAVWHPFYANSADVSVSKGSVKVSYYEYRDMIGRTCRLIFCANASDRPSGKVHINFHRKPNLIKTVFGSDPEFENGILSVSFHDFDCTVIYTES